MRVDVGPAKSMRDPLRDARPERERDADIEYVRGPVGDAALGSEAARRSI